MRTYQLFNKNSEYYNIYCQQNGTVIANTAYYTWNIECEANTRYVLNWSGLDSTNYDAAVKLVSNPYQITSIDDICNNTPNAANIAGSTAIAYTTTDDDTYLQICLAFYSFTDNGQDSDLQGFLNNALLFQADSGTDRDYIDYYILYTYRTAVSEANEYTDTKISTLTEYINTQNEVNNEYTDIKISQVSNELAYKTKIRTSQLFNKNDYILEKLYSQVSGATVADNRARSITIPIESDLRYVVNWSTLDSSYFDMTYSWQIKLSTYSEIPAAGTNWDGTLSNFNLLTNIGSIISSSNSAYLLITIFYSSTSTNDIPDNFIECVENLLNNLYVTQLDSGTGSYEEYYTDGLVDDLNELVQSKINAGVSKANEYTDSSINQLNISNNPWYGKTIIWFGISIPEGKDTALNSENMGEAYPTVVGNMLGAIVINKALGSSMIRANTRYGDYTDALSYNVMRSLSMTTAEKQDLINNWDTYRLKFRDPSTVTELSDSVQTIMLGSSFEERLMPYLNGTYAMPDLFVIDHGHNDWKYYLADNTSDITLEPTIENIESGNLAEDIYMTSDNYANLISFMGDLSGIHNIESFAASINRNCYCGAINFICALILHYNPRARIVFISNYENWQKIDLITAQNYNANSWNFPICKLYEYLGFGGHIIPGTATYWDESGTTDLTQRNIYYSDNVHPHTDTNGNAVTMYATIIANFLKNCV